MDINTAEQNLTDWAAERCGMTRDRQMRRGELPAGTPGARVRFTSGHTGNAQLSEFVAEVRGVFPDPDAARSFASAIWGSLPVYSVAGFAALVGEGEIVFAEEKGHFTATGMIRALF